MRHLKRLRGWSCVLAVFLIVGCDNTEKKTEMAEAHLPELTLAVQGKLRYDHSIDVSKMTDQQLLADTWKNNSSLRDTFSHLVVKLLHNEREVVVLVCSSDGKHPLLEDVSWDRLKVMRRNQNQAPEFTRSLDEAPKTSTP